MLPYGHDSTQSPTPQHFELRNSPFVRKWPGMSTRPTGQDFAQSSVVQRRQTSRSRTFSRKNPMRENAWVIAPV